MHGLTTIRRMNGDLPRDRRATSTTHRVSAGRWTYDPSKVPALLDAIRRHQGDVPPEVFAAAFDLTRGKGMAKASP